MLEIKHEKVCAANKSLKQEKEDLAKDVNKLKVALKSSEKDVKNFTYRFEKKVGTLEENINDLNDFKSSKLSEEKDLKSKIKKYDKKLKLIQEKEAKLAIATKDFMKREALTGSSAVDNFDSVAVEDREEIGENLNQVNVSELQVDTSEIPSCVQSHSSKTLNMDPTILKTTTMDPTILKTTDMDPTTLKITMSVNTDTSATNSLEPTRSHLNLKDTQPNSFEKELATEPIGRTEREHPELEQQSW